MFWTNLGVIVIYGLVVFAITYFLIMFDDLILDGLVADTFKDIFDKAKKFISRK